MLPVACGQMMMDSKPMAVWSVVMWSVVMGSVVMGSVVMGSVVTKPASAGYRRQAL